MSFKTPEKINWRNLEDVKYTRALRGLEPDFRVVKKRKTHILKVPLFPPVGDT